MCQGYCTLFPGMGLREVKDSARETFVQGSLRVDRIIASECAAGWEVDIRLPKRGTGQKCRTQLHFKHHLGFRNLFPDGILHSAARQPCPVAVPAGEQWISFRDYEMGALMSLGVTCTEYR